MIYNTYADLTQLEEGGDLAEWVDQVDLNFEKASPQHPTRRWEYALALSAIDAWQSTRHLNGWPPIADVGGSGSPFFRMVDAARTYVLDPREDPGCTLETYVTSSRARLFPVVTCLSVIEHIPVNDLPTFLYHLSCLVQPGGLLVITCDACGCYTHPPTEEPHHFHWMREQIFTPAALAHVPRRLEQYGFLPFGPTAPPRIVDAITPTVHDYTFAAIVLQKASTVV